MSVLSERVLSERYKRVREGHSTSPNSPPTSKWMEKMEQAYVGEGAPLFRLAYSLTGDAGAAEDLFHEAFIRVFSRPRPLDDSELVAYLHRTIVNLARRKWQRQRIERTLLARNQVLLPPVSFEALPEAVWRLLLGLPIRQRAAIVLRYYEDLTETEIAARLGCSPGAARSLVHRGMSRIRREMQGGFDEC